MTTKELGHILGWMEIIVGSCLVMLGGSGFWSGAMVGEPHMWKIIGGLFGMVCGGLIIDEGRLKFK